MMRKANFLVVILGLIWIFGMFGHTVAETEQVWYLYSSFYPKIMILIMVMTVAGM